MAATGQAGQAGCPRGETMVQLSSALSFLETCRSDFVAAGASWLRDRQDPGEVLIVASGPLSSTLGPWETYRMLAALGLDGAGSVRELALDVLAEPYEGSMRPPVAQALAIAWAHRAHPAEEAVGAEAVLAALKSADDPAVPAPLLDAALLALTGPRGPCDDDAVYARAMGGCSRALETERAPIWAIAVLEACLTGGPDSAHTLSKTARRTLADAQEEDGGFPSLTRHHIVRGMVSLRAVALLQQGG